MPDTTPFDGLLTDAREALRLACEAYNEAIDRLAAATEEDDGAANAELWNAVQAQWMLCEVRVRVLEKLAADWPDTEATLWPDSARQFTDRLVLEAQIRERLEQDISTHARAAIDELNAGGQG